MMQTVVLGQDIRFKLTVVKAFERKPFLVESIGAQTFNFSLHLFV
jgi:hypothetical protein